GASFAASLGRPGGSVTGIAVGNEVLVKQVDVLRALVPNLFNVGIVWHGAPGSPNETSKIPALASAIRDGGLQPHSLQIDAADIAGSLDVVGREHPDGLIVIQDPVTLEHRVEITGFAARAHLPAVYG